MENFQRIDVYFFFFYTFACTNLYYYYYTTLISYGLSLNMKFNELNNNYILAVLINNYLTLVKILSRISYFFFFLQIEEK